MEKSNSEALLKSKSSRSCIRTGYHLYMSDFRGIFRRSWIAALFYGVCFSALVTILVIYYPRLNLSVLVNPHSLSMVISDYMTIFVVTLLAVIVGGISEIVLYARGLDTNVWRTLKAFLATLLIALPLTIVTLGIGLLLALPLLQSLFSYLYNPERKYWHNVWHSYKLGLKHWGKWFVVSLITFIVAGLLSCIILLPANILCLANVQANMGILFDDPLGMPSYSIPMTATVMFIAGVVEGYIRLSILHVFRVTYESNEASASNEKSESNEKDIIY